MEDPWRFRKDRTVVPLSGIRTGYAVFWLDAEGFAFRAHYFEAYGFIRAYRRALHKKHRMHEDLNSICGMFVQKASPALEKRYFFELAPPFEGTSEFIEIESHLYAPKHLLPR